MFRANIGYKTNTYTSGGGDSMARLPFVKQFKNMVMLSRSKWLHKGLRGDLMWGVVETWTQSIYMHFK